MRPSPLADRIRREREDVANRLTEESVARNPALRERAGGVGELRTLEDYGYVLDYLATALDLGTERPFLDFCRWTTGVLSARNIAPATFAGALGHIERALRERFGREIDGDAAAWLAEARWVVLAEPAPPSAAPATGSDPFSDERERFRDAALSGDRRRALAAVREALDAGMDLRTVNRELVTRSLHEIGSLWEENRITAADEHLATAVIQSVLTHLYPDLPIGPRDRGVAVIMGVAGELHQVGAHMVADLLETDGWDVRFLGTNVPAPAVAHTLEETNADVLGVVLYSRRAPAGSAGSSARRATSRRRSRRSATRTGSVASSGLLGEIERAKGRGRPRGGAALHDLERNREVGRP